MSLAEPNGNSTSSISEDSSSSTNSTQRIQHKFLLPTGSLPQQQQQQQQQQHHHHHHGSSVKLIKLCRVCGDRAKSYHVIIYFVIKELFSF